jgi:glutathione S-transferase
LRWIIFDNQKVNGFLGPFRFLKNFAKPAGDPAVLAFLKGRIDGNLAIVNKRLSDRQFLLGNRPTIADVHDGLSLLSRRRVWFSTLQRITPQSATWLERMKGAARVEAPLRPYAGLSAGKEIASVQARRPIPP